MPQLNAFPSCCGASVITGFGGSPDDEWVSPNRYYYNYETQRTELTKDGPKVTQGDSLLRQIETGYANRIYTCILTVAQYKLWGKWLKANGFQFTHKFVNSVHNSVLYHFVYIKKTPRCKVKNNLEPPAGWEDFPGPTPNAKSSKDAAAVPPSVEAVAA